MSLNLSIIPTLTPTKCLMNCTPECLAEFGWCRVKAGTGGLADYGFCSEVNYLPDTPSYRLEFHRFRNSYNQNGFEISDTH